MVSEIVVTHCDRLCRFAFDLIEYMFSLHSMKLMVLFDEPSSDEHVLSQDILAINTIFICRIQRRRAKYKSERKPMENKNNKNTKQKKMKNQNYCELNVINQNISESFSEKDIEEMASSKNFEWIKLHTLNEKLKLYIDVKEGKDFNEKDKKLQRSCVWGERKFLRTVVWLELRVKGLHDKVPANIIDECIDEALIARKNIIQKNLKETKKSSLSFKSKNDL
ncbi:13991_t:CDS:2 [Cetraspora pellucida]|uniref:13991_t:CDS:1 n=1 Tax=Cetraspora pellucida TaxID=1433469 RepID=A0A9N9DHQ9_9GLOM|nr:13991_t:CDS:2 [Cetraspora pellucida]